jgi:ComF family protein
VYQQDIRSLHHRFKFHRDLTAGRALAQLMAAHLRQRPDKLPEVLIPIPLHPKRMRQRGFDQAHELSKDLGRLLQLPYLPTALERIVHTQAQSTLSRTARQRNLRHAFRLHAPLDYQHIALVDDVMTTGATFTAVATLCRQAGVQQIEVWAVSRTLAP